MNTTTCETNNDCCAERVLNTPCPVEVSVEKNTKAFFEAMHQAKVEIIKEKIKADWGDCLAKEADAIVKAMGTHWQSMLQQAKAQCELRETLKQGYVEACGCEDEKCG